MTTLYLDHRELRIKQEGRALALYQAGKRQGTIPVGMLDRVVMRGSVALDTGVLATLADSGVGILILAGRNGRKQALVMGRSHNEALRRIGQYQLFGDEPWRRRWSALVIALKLKGQLRLLRRASYTRRDLRHPLAHAIGTIEQLLPDVAARPLRPHLLGIEGAAAAAYFSAYTKLFPPSLNFTGRNRRPPRDPVNAALSLAYTLVHGEAVLALHSAGLDPLIGFYHELVFGRASLASDFVEPLRPRVDRWVWGLFRDRSLRAEDFSREGDACLLGKSGRKVFFGAIQTELRLIRKLLRRYSGQLAAHAVASAPVAKQTSREDES